MVFSSSIFLFVFLPLILCGYYLMKLEYRNIFLLIVSLFFYMWGEPKFVWIMILSIIINYCAGLIIFHTNHRYGKNMSNIVLAVGILANLGLLMYFKYWNFAISSINQLVGTDIALRNIALPIGISFFTFQGMSYIIDLYRGNAKVQRNIINMALYIALFPQLVAGPIVRYIDINEQIEDRETTFDKFVIGTRRFIIGLSKKVIIANQVGYIADQIFNNTLSELSMSIAWVGAICYTIQIYFDFSGYSDMAIGLGKMFGFDFLENFNYPYISKSVTEFWRRWHISLSSWFRDYIYIPLGGNRSGNVYFNLLVVFLVTGLWHGAAWNFVLWGLWHGMFLIIERIIKKNNIRFKIPGTIKWAITMLVVIVGWVLFRAPNLEFAWEYIKVMFSMKMNKNMSMTAFWYLTPKVIVTLILGIMASLPLNQYAKKKFSILEGTYFKIILMNIGTIILFFFSIMYVITSTYNPFIYFRF